MNSEMILDRVQAQSAHSERVREATLAITGVLFGQRNPARQLERVTRLRDQLNSEGSDAVSAEALSAALRSIADSIDDDAIDTDGDAVRLDVHERS
ncbi:hypothetical protein [Candidatus Poriferisodalis sp.]|uniref:hypothetical protein n=1 Tax=Candidatus Poriferisodalis sp. TaxID=3101277 RepID=UPI003D113925